MAHEVQWLPATCPVTLPMKRANLRQRVYAPYRGVAKIEPVDSVPTVCISVDSPSRTFLAGREMVPTHNTVIRRMEPFLAKSTEMAQAFATDGHTVLNVGGEQLIEDRPPDEDDEELGADGQPIEDAETVEPNVQQGEVIIPPASKSGQMTEAEVREAEALAAQDDAPFDS